MKHGIAGLLNVKYCHNTAKTHITPVRPEKGNIMEPNQFQWMLEALNDIDDTLLCILVAIWARIIINK